MAGMDINNEIFMCGNEGEKLVGSVSCQGTFLSFPPLTSTVISSWRGYLSVLVPGKPDVQRLTNAA